METNTARRVVLKDILPAIYCSTPIDSSIARYRAAAPLRLSTETLQYCSILAPFCHLSTITFEAAVYKCPARPQDQATVSTGLLLRLG